MNFPRISPVFGATIKKSDAGERLSRRRVAFPFLWCETKFSFHVVVRRFIHNILCVIVGAPSVCLVPKQTIVYCAMRTNECVCRITSSEVRRNAFCIALRRMWYAKKKTHSHTHLNTILIKVKVWVSEKEKEGRAMHSVCYLRKKIFRLTDVFVRVSEAANSRKNPAKRMSWCVWRACDRNKE